MKLLEQKWVRWLGLWLAILLPGAGLTALLAAQGASRLAGAVGWLTAIAAAGWLFWGLWSWREIRWVKVFGWYIASGLAALLLTAGLWSAGHPGAALSIAGMWGMAVAFVAGLLLIRLVLSPGQPIFGVARTLIDEAIRMKVALVFIVGLLLLVPILPIAASEQERLEYRIQAFLSWSLITIGVLLGLLTMFLACSTVAGEISSRRIFMTMTKPITRWQFLVGKWLGIVLLNALLLGVSGVAVYAFARVLQKQPTSAMDRVAVDEQVLVARTSVRPVPPGDMDFDIRFQQRLEQLQAEQPERYSGPLSEKDRQAIQQGIIASWQSMAPGRSSTFIFQGLGQARQYSNVVQFRFKAKAGGPTPDEMVHLGFRFNDGPVEQVVVADDNFHVKNLSVRAINPSGVIKLEIINLAPPVEEGGFSVSFPPGEGMEMLYRVGSFEGNLVRGLLVTLAKLAFVAMLGLAAGCFLSFPVAVLLTMLVYFTAGSSEFLAESLRFYAGYNDEVGLWEMMTSVFGLLWQHLVNGEGFEILKLLIRLVGESFVAITPAFGRYDTVASLADGRVIPWAMVAEAVGRIGVLGTGLCGLIGWAIFQRRELARVTV